LEFAQHLMRKIQIKMKTTENKKLFYDFICSKLRNFATVNTSLSERIIFLLNKYLVLGTSLSKRNLDLFYFLSVRLL